MSEEHRKILLVEDDEDDYVLVRDLLRDISEAAYTVEWQSDYDKALEAAHSGKFDVILLDHRLGAHTGLEFLSTIKQAGCLTPVLLLTGGGDRELDVAAMRAGAADYLNKNDLRPDLLERAIRYAIERVRTQDKVSALNQRLIEEQARLLRAERLSSIGVLAASIAHEINNPLCGIMNLARSLRDRGMPEPKYTQYLDTIQDALERMRGTVQGLLDYARDRPSQLEQIGASDFIEATLRLATPAMHRKRITVSTHVEERAGRLFGDRSRLMQVLLNLLLNAVYATPVGGHIEISTHRKDGPKGAMTGISVTDNGAGIPEEILAKIYEPFFTTKPSGQGTGLGLAVSSSIIKAHGGTLTLENGPQGGAVATFWLPLPTSLQDV